MSKERYLVYGARAGSLGWAVASLLVGNGMTVQTIGISGDEDVKCDILDEDELTKVLLEYRPTDILCTVGINGADTPFDNGFNDSFSEHMAVNAFGPLNLLRLWVNFGQVTPGSHFAVVSSNSAHVARSKSASYCMSKAALSMGIRCAAREFANVNGSVAHIYAWEFGLLKGTPMTAQTKEDFPGALTRMPGLPDGFPQTDAAEYIMGALMSTGRGLNGSILRVDGGEQ